jgi:putative sigma-54 modulation protein
MEINIQSIHFTEHSDLHNFVMDKVAKLDRFNNDILSGEVCLKLDKSSTKENKICEIKLVIPGNDLFAKKQCATFEEATAQAVDALHHQLQKHKK